jgi:hypothetical protein
MLRRHTLDDLRELADLATQRASIILQVATTASEPEALEIIEAQLLGMARDAAVQITRGLTNRTGLMDARLPCAPSREEE